MIKRAAVALSLLSLLATVSINAAIPTSERTALIAFYEASNGANWTNKSNWLGAAGTECTWAGVVCDAMGLTITGLVLSTNNLGGVLSPAVAQLTNLTELNVPFNQIGGSIPVELAQLPKLTTLVLAVNKLTGGIPPQLGQISTLEILDLRENPLGGTIPPQLGQLSNLKVLWIWANQLTGPIPPELGNLANAEVFTVRSNQLSGTIPPQLGNLSKLRILELWDNNLSGPIPIELGQLRSLEGVYLMYNELSGEIPDSLAALPNVGEFQLHGNQLTGAIPPRLGEMTSLTALTLGDNRFTGPIPAELGNLTALELLHLSGNELDGSIPASLGNLSSLRELELSQNDLTGSIPPELGDLAALEYLGLGLNGLSGPLPASLGRLSNLSGLYIPFTDITGPIPAELGNLTKLTYIDLGVCRLSGELPASLGNLKNLQYLKLWYNAFTGEVPASFAGLTSLVDNDGLGLAFNGLFTSNSDLRAFLDLKEYGTYPFESLQTLAPSAIAATTVSPTSINVTWTPIDYQFDSGGYRVEVATSPNGPFTLKTTTANKSLSLATVTGLTPATQYYVRVSTVTFASGSQKNTVISTPGAAVTSTTLPSQPAVILTNTPELLTVTSDGSSTSSTTYTLSNLGQSATPIQLSQNGAFFTQSPASFVLGAGATQTVTITSLPQAAASSFRGTSTPVGNGVPSSLVVPVSLLAAAPLGAGDPQVIVVTQRVDVAAAAGTNPTGSVTFKNIGTAPATGLLAADVAWIVPDPATIVLAPGEQKSASFTIDRARRPDSAAPAGTLTATLSFVYITRGTAPSRSTLSGLPTLAAPVTVGDTVTPPVTASGIPLLGDGEIGLVIPGLTNSTGVSDVAIGNALSGLLASDLKLFFLSGSGSSEATQPVAAGASVALSDVVSTVFGTPGQSGALHVRSTLASQLGLSAINFSANGASGTRGTAIPVFRTNRALAKGARLMLTGLRKSGTVQTSLSVQEASGAAATVDVTFLAPGGEELGNVLRAVGPFAGTTIGQELVPDGTVSVVVSNHGDGSVVIYGTLTDTESGDSWTVTDWNGYFGRLGNVEQVVPIASSAPGRNDSYYRTDISLANSGTVAASGTLRYYQERPLVAVVDKPLNVEPYATLALGNVVAGFFGVETPSIGHVVLIPSEGAMTMTSRTYTTTSGTTQTLGTGVPALTRTESLRLGQARVIGALRDSTFATTYSRRARSFRTNIGLVETEGKSATVRVSLLLFDGRALAAGGTTAAKSYVLAPNQLLQLNEIAAQILGPTRESDYGELDNVQVKVEVTAGEGGVMVWASSTDNGSGDTTLRVE